MFSIPCKAFLLALGSMLLLMTSPGEAKPSSIDDDKVMVFPKRNADEIHQDGIALRRVYGSIFDIFDPKECIWSVISAKAIVDALIGVCSRLEALYYGHDYKLMLRDWYDELREIKLTVDRQIQHRRTEKILRWSNNRSLPRVNSALNRALSNIMELYKVRYTPMFYRASLMKLGVNLFAARLHISLEIGDLAFTEKFEIIQKRVHPLKTEINDLIGVRSQLYDFKKSNTTRRDYRIKVLNGAKSTLEEQITLTLGMENDFNISRHRHLLDIALMKLGRALEAIKKVPSIPAQKDSERRKFAREIKTQSGEAVVWINYYIKDFSKETADGCGQTNTRPPPTPSIENALRQKCTEAEKKVAGCLNEGGCFTVFVLGVRTEHCLCKGMWTGKRCDYIDPGSFEDKTEAAHSPPAYYFNPSSTSERDLVKRRT